MQDVKGKEGSNLGQQLHEFMQLVGKFTTSPHLAILNESGLTLPQIITLNILANHGEHTVSLTAEKLRLSMAATSHLVDVMVRHGYVTRSEDETDRRKKSIAITAKGSRMLERLEKSRIEGFESTFAVLDAGTRAEFDSVMRKVIDQLREHNDAQCSGGER